MLKDRYGRSVESIRISVTSRCNLRCFYCHNEGQEYTKREMTAEEIERILEIAKGLEITQVKFTGGEPLLRDDIIEIVKAGSKHMRDVSMTTNGTLLAYRVRELKKAGLNRVNISMDSADRKRYEEITGMDMVDKVMNGIEEAVKAGLHPVKVNVVAFPDYMEDLMETLKKIWELGAVPQVIETINVGRSSKVYAIDEVERKISAMAVDVRERKLHRRKIYTIPYEGKMRDVEIVRPTHNSQFCAH
ncbi:MAG TPA: GTP 3',8-cyclase MoaA, partial [Thermoplasmatales archaeon]|nr:GTP 3',8-cyclase MoaA [Thermoplasmatales archaeon]